MSDGLISLSDGLIGLSNFVKMNSINIIILKSEFKSNSFL